MAPSGRQLEYYEDKSPFALRCGLLLELKLKGIGLYSHFTPLTTHVRECLSLLFVIFVYFSGYFCLAVFIFPCLILQYSKGQHHVCERLIHILILIQKWNCTEHTAVCGACSWLPTGRRDSACRAAESSRCTMLAWPGLALTARAGEGCECGHTGLAVTVPTLAPCQCF